ALQTCPDSRDAITKHMLALSTYLGHSKVAHTYWYLEAVPELMRDIADRAEQFAMGRRACPGPQTAETRGGGSRKHAPLDAVEPPRSPGAEQRRGLPVKSSHSYRPKQAHRSLRISRPS